jgi:hypothetical protein
VSQLFPPRENREIYGGEDFASVLKIHGHRSATVAADIITIVVDSLITKL